MLRVIDHNRGTIETEGGPVAHARQTIDCLADARSARVFVRLVVDRFAAAAGDVAS